MGKNEKKDNQPPSLFDNLDMFAAKPAEKKGEAASPFFSAGFAANISRLSNRLGG